MDEQTPPKLSLWRTNAGYCCGFREHNGVPGRGAVPSKAITSWLDRYQRSIDIFSMSLRTQKDVENFAGLLGISLRQAIALLRAEQIEIGEGLEGSIKTLSPSLKHGFAGAEWLKQQPALNPSKITPFACLVADILGIVYQGLYHLGNDFLYYRKVEWYREHQITLFLDRTISTYDNSAMTYLVLLCHQVAVRLAIRPVVIQRLQDGILHNSPALEMVFTRTKPDGKAYERHPSLDEAIAKLNSIMHREDAA